MVSLVLLTAVARLPLLLSGKAAASNEFVPTGDAELSSAGSMCCVPGNSTSHSLKLTVWLSAVSCLRARQVSVNARLTDVFPDLAAWLCASDLVPEGPCALLIRCAASARAAVAAVQTTALAAGALLTATQAAANACSGTEAGRCSRCGLCRPVCVGAHEPMVAGGAATCCNLRLSDQAHVSMLCT